MSKKLIFGHKNPDTDTICSSLVMENFGKENGCDVEAVRLGNINKETKYVLDYLKIDAPRFIEKIEDWQEVILVDHNEFSQSVDNIENAKIHRVIDHHRIKNFETAEPLYYTAEPVGCTCTILYGIYTQAGIKITEKIATLMLSAIISDTLLFKSPTCTKKDVEVAKKLAEIANINVEEYGMNLLKAGTDMSDLTASEMINLDAKEFEFGDAKAVVAQVNTASIEETLKRKDEIKKAMQDVIKEKSLNLFMLAITDIVDSNSQVIALGDKASLVEKAYNVKLEDDMAFLKGVVSRKKQMVPNLTEAAK